MFIGHSVQDTDIRAVLEELSELNAFRPRYYIVAPDVDEVKMRFWESKKITLIKGTFEEFLQALDSQIPVPSRSLAVVAVPPSSHPIQKYFRTNDPLSSATLESLGKDVVYVNGIAATTQVNPREFYKGLQAGSDRLNKNSMYTGEFQTKSRKTTSSEIRARKQREQKLY